MFAANDFPPTVQVTQTEAYWNSGGFVREFLNRRRYNSIRFCGTISRRGRNS